jgi:hypothetical protein
MPRRPQAPQENGVNPGVSFPPFVKSRRLERQTACWGNENHELATSSAAAWGEARPNSLRPRGAARAAPTREALERSGCKLIGVLDARNKLRLGRLGLCSDRLSASEPFRSAVPLAAAGIVCLGLVPTLGGPERPIHWIMTAGMVGFGALMWARHRLRGPKVPLLRAPNHAVHQAGRVLLVVGGTITALVGSIVGFRLQSGGSIGALSLVLPGAGLVWVAVIALQALRYREPAAEPPTTGDRPSRRPPNRDPLAKPQSTSSRPGPPDRHVSA